MHVSSKATSGQPRSFIQKMCIRYGHCILRRGIAERCRVKPHYTIQERCHFALIYGPIVFHFGISLLTSSLSLIQYPLPCWSEQRWAKTVLNWTACHIAHWAKFRWDLDLSAIYQNSSLAWLLNLRHPHGWRRGTLQRRCWWMPHEMFVKYLGRDSIWQRWICHSSEWY